MSRRIYSGDYSVRGQVRTFLEDLYPSWSLLREDIQEEKITEVTRAWDVDIEFISLLDFTSNFIEKEPAPF